MMPDREKVIKGLETIKQFFGYGLPSTAEMFDSYYGILNDAIALLKEQDAVVRCKDCKYGRKHNVNIIECMKAHDYNLEHQEFHHENWFCADGERRDDDA